MTPAQIGFVIVAVVALTVPPQAQQAGAPSTLPPRVVYAHVPTYPREAANRGVAGVVVIKVTTDGQRIVEARVQHTAESAVLAEAAVRNVKTWRFAPHPATTFDVQFKYSIVDRPCDSLGRDTHAAAVIQFPSSVDVFTERDPDCPSSTRPPPVFGIFMHQASVPFFPPGARANGVDGKITVGVTYKGVLSLDDGPEELGNPIIEEIRDWMLVPGPYGEKLTFNFKLADGECRGGPKVVVGPGLTSYEITDTRTCK